MQLPTSKPKKKKKKRVQKKAIVKESRPPGPSTTTNGTTGRVPKNSTMGTPPLVHFWDPQR